MLISLYGEEYRTLQTMKNVNIEHFGEMLVSHLVAGIVFPNLQSFLGVYPQVCETTRKVFIVDLLAYSGFLKISEEVLLELRDETPWMSRNKGIL
jgi:hypothetical protein